MDESDEGKRKPSKDRHNCCVPQCSDVKIETNHMHQVPRDERERRKWAIAIKTGKELNPKMTVCSKHFLATDYIISRPGAKKRRLKPNVVPSQHLPTRSHDKVLPSPVKRRSDQRASRAAKRALKCLTNMNNTADGLESAGEGDDLCSDDDAAGAGGGEADETVGGEADAAANVPTINDEDAEKFKNVGIQADLDADSNSVVLSLLSSDKRLFSCTGIHSIKLLDALTKCVDKIAAESPLKKFLLCTRDRILLTMMKIKLAISYSSIAAIFGLTNGQTCANYFYDTVMLLQKVLKCMIQWPDKEDVLKNMPKSFSGFKSTRVILDAYEIKVEKPKCIVCRVRLYSQYKKNFTAKIMMMCSPSGLVTHCAPAFGGRASDKVVTQFTGIYDLCDPGDGIMVDKGFNIDEECQDGMFVLIRPPFQRNKKYTKAESVHCAKVARARVHVERAIQRVREYELLNNKVPWYVCPYLDDIVVIVSALVNLGKPIMALDKF